MKTTPGSSTRRLVDSARLNLAAGHGHGAGLAKDPVTEPVEFFETRTAELIFVRSARARHYRLTLRKDGVAVATIPVRGSETEARRFVEAHGDWLARARARQARKPRVAENWTLGTAVLWRGELTEIRRA